ncbi:hypothetical protein LNKW23_39820 [Paralimibaculum aggregatum]|uniref:Phosphodiester glycosidase domain-containing protein n=1 Tax=Paralimibaculum aggregatum TaxID=3036245 RepID=A0ABQ6LNI7_9RHOB|nr:hypothetical protein [Limibaculum sp. NKW23]GMG84766.1 hypothetical protein LNKW23_39820 [Limibaculum sp. NKW23]
MRHRLAAALALAGTLLALPAAACPDAGPQLLLRSCSGGDALAARLLLLPDEAPPAEPATETWVMTGAYTGEDRRADGGPMPVGLFVHGGRIINPNLGRMDGILLIGPDGRLGLHHRRRVAFAGARIDLTDLGARLRFARAAAQAGLSVAQSHLLIVDGAVDVKPRQDAPRFVRRILFTSGGGFGVWQSPLPMTLAEATEALAAAHAPEMALNLDMGSYDYCWRLDGGAATRCGLVDRADTARFSNFLVVARRPGG